MLLFPTFFLANKKYFCVSVRPLVSARGVERPERVVENLVHPGFVIVVAAVAVAVAAAIALESLAVGDKRLGNAAKVRGRLKKKVKVF